MNAIDLAEELFKIHTHAYLHFGNEETEIVYREKDIVELLKKLGHPEPDFEGYGKKCDRELLSPPGDTIKEMLEERGWSIADFTKKLQGPLSLNADEWNLKKVSNLLKGNLPIDKFIAEDLERVLNVPKEFWLNRQKDYSEKLAKL